MITNNLLMLNNLFPLRHEGGQVVVVIAANCFARIKKKF